MIYLKFLIIILFLFCEDVYSQENTSQQIRIMFYNVENAFDTVDDTSTNDDDFLPGGMMRWNQSRYEKKINSLYKTIIAAGGWSPPEIVAFCEVENRKVLEDLVYGTYLSKYNYSIIHEDSPDRRGIDVCLIFRKNIIDVAGYDYWIPESTRDGFTSRSVLYVKMAYRDTIHLIVNHWPSRKGGVLAGEDLRMKIASMIKEKTDSISGHSAEGASIIMLGDFNCTPDDQEMKMLVSQQSDSNTFVNLAVKKADEGLGTYRYMGTWEMIDQVLVSERLFSGKKGLYTNNELLTIFKPEFLLIKDPKYPGSSPFSTYRGYRYQGGFSDHLPVIVDLRLRSQAPRE